MYCFSDFQFWFVEICNFKFAPSIWSYCMADYSRKMFLTVLYGGEGGRREGKGGGGGVFWWSSDANGRVSRQKRPQGLQTAAASQGNTIPTNQPTITPTICISYQATSGETAGPQGPLVGPQAPLVGPQAPLVRHNNQSWAHATTVATMWQCFKIQQSVACRLTATYEVETPFWLQGVQSFFVF